jgi:hypothetical protein
MDSSETSQSRSSILFRRSTHIWSALDGMVQGTIYKTSTHYATAFVQNGIQYTTAVPVNQLNLNTWTPVIRRTTSRRITQLVSRRHFRLAIPKADKVLGC